MKLIRCPKCSTLIRQDLAECPVCFYRMTVKPTPSGPPGPWRRFGGMVVDAFMYTLIAGIVAVIYSALRGELELAPVAAIAWVVSLGVNTFPLVRAGQTLGKLAMGTRIVDMNGNAPGLGRLLLLRPIARDALLLIPIAGAVASLVNAFLIFGDERRCLHDYLSGTRVVNDQE